MGYLDQMRDELEQANALENADAPSIGNVKMNQKTAGRRIMAGGPKFRAQFDITCQYLRTGAGNVDNPILAVPLFGANDYNAQYPRAIAKSSGLSGDTVIHVYPDMGGVGIAGLSAVAGDIVIEYVSTNGSHFVVLHCTSVAMASLVAATASDRFITNLLRYSLPSTTNLNQFNEPLEFYKQGLFGKTLFDTMNPISYKNPDQNQANLIDIPASFLIDKETTLLTYIRTSNFSTIGVQTTIYSMSIFVEADIRTSFNK